MRSNETIGEKHKKTEFFSYSKKKGLEIFVYALRMFANDTVRRVLDNIIKDHDYYRKKSERLNLCLVDAIYYGYLSYQYEDNNILDAVDRVERCVNNCLLIEKIIGEKKHV